MKKGSSNADSNAKQRPGKKLGGCTGRGFLPGKSGNPSGKRPTKGLLSHLRAELGEDVEGSTAEQLIARKLVALALAGEIAAIRECLDRTCGKPAQQLNVADVSDQYKGKSIEEIDHFAITGEWLTKESDGDGS